MQSNQDKSVSPDFVRSPKSKIEIQSKNLESQQRIYPRTSIDISLNKTTSKKVVPDNTNVNYLTPFEYMTYENIDKMKTHRGPLNLDAITMRDPNKLMDNLCFGLDKLRVSYKRIGYFSIRCEFFDMKFSIEINLIEKFPNMFALKFYKGNQATDQYFELCDKIFEMLQL